LTHSVAWSSAALEASEVARTHSGIPQTRRPRSLGTALSSSSVCPWGRRRDRGQGGAPIGGVHLSRHVRREQTTISTWHKCAKRTCQISGSIDQTMSMADHVSRDTPKRRGTKLSYNPYPRDITRNRRALFQRHLRTDFFVIFSLRIERMEGRVSLRLRVAAPGRAAAGARAQKAPSRRGALCRPG
jgi:hypothetical protein